MDLFLREGLEEKKTQLREQIYGCLKTEDGARDSSGPYSGMCGIRTDVSY